MPPHTAPSPHDAEIQKLRTELAATQAVLALSLVLQAPSRDGRFDPESLGVAIAEDQREHFAATVESLLAQIQRIESATAAPRAA